MCIVHTRFSLPEGPRLYEVMKTVVELRSKIWNEGKKYF